MKDVELTTLQSLGHELGTENAMRHCAPIDFYMLLTAAGYLDPDLSAAQFCAQLDGQELLTHTFNEYDWSRPALSHYLRQAYGARIVSWWLNGQADLEKMKKAGYIQTAEEETFFKDKIMGRSVKEIVQTTFPVIATLKPGFGGTPSKNIHAVVIINWNDNEVQVADPDARNGRTTFTPTEVESHLSLEGAGSIVLPK